MKYALFILCVASAWATNTCASLGVDAITQYGARISWNVQGTASPDLTYHQIIYVTDATWVSNGNSFGSTPNIVSLQGVSSAGNISLGGSIFNATANTLYHYSPRSSDVSTNTNGVFTSSNTCTNVTGTFTTLAAQTESQRHPTPPAIFNPGNTFPLTGHTWTEGVDCSSSQDCINQANSHGANDSALILPQSETYDNSSNYFYLPTSPAAVQFTITSYGSASMQLSASAPSWFTNGQQVVLGSQYSLPAPL